MRKYLLLLAFLPVTAFGQNLISSSYETEFSRAYFSEFAGPGISDIRFAPFNVPGCYPTPTTQGNLVLSIVRATPANSSDNTQSCASGELAVESDGMSAWHGATNFVLNSGTHPKTAQATASIASSATPYLAWHEGTGTMTLAAGTATVTGLSCTAVAAGTICTFTVTVTGTMSITTTAGSTFAQIELATCANCFYKSPKIATTAAAVTRNPQNISISNADMASWTLHLTNKWCVAITAKPYYPWNVSNLLSHPWLFGTSGSANSAYLIKNGTNLIFNTVDSASAVKNVTFSVSALSDQNARRVVACNNNGDLSMCIDGVQVGTVGGVGTGLWNGVPSATGSIGSNSGNIRQWDGDLSGFRICRGATKCSECR